MKKPVRTLEEKSVDMSSYTISFLKQLESESIHIMREVAAEFKNPVMLYSVGKDSSVMVRLAQKAFYPGKFPFPLMHIDTGYKFPEMYDFREEFCRKIGAELIVERNESVIAQGCHPLNTGVDKCCSYLKTGALLDAIRKHGFDAAFGEARREEEKSRAKERVFPFVMHLANGIRRISGPNSGIYTIPASTKAKQCGFSP